jgi:hypothetical protein
VLASEAKGRGFESRLAHQKIIKIREVTSFSDFLFFSKIPLFCPRLSHECPKSHHVL